MKPLTQETKVHSQPPADSAGEGRTQMNRRQLCRRQLLFRCLIGSTVAITGIVLMGPCVAELARKRLGHLLIARIWFTGGGQQVRSISFSPDGKNLAVGYSFPPLTCIWDVKSGAQRLVIEEKEHEAIEKVTYSSDGKFLAVEIEKLSETGSGGQYVRIRQADTGKLVREYDNLGGVIFTQDGDLRIGDKIVKIPDGTLVRRLVTSTPKNFWGTDFGIGRNDTLLGLSGFIDGTHKHPRIITLIWDFQTGHLLKSLKCPELEPHKTCAEGKSIDFHPDGKHVVIGTVDNAFYVWNIDSDDVKIIRHDGGRWWTAAYNADGQLVAASGAGGVILIWNMNENKELCTLKRHVGSVYAVEFSPKEDLLATGGMDGVVRLWGETGHLRKEWGLVRELRLR